MNWTKIIYDSEYSFQPITGKNYYLYKKKNNSYFLSLIEPNQWNKNFIGTFILKTMERGKKLNKMINNETVLITGENGSLAKKVKDQLKQIGFNVITYTSRKKSTKNNTHYWNIEKKTLNLDVLKKCDHIIHLAGFSIIKPWTNKNKKLMYDSRVLSSRLLL